MDALSPTANRDRGRSAVISPQAFHAALAAAGVDFFTGVPDSLLKSFNAYTEATLPAERHITAANEGTAVGLAAGFHLASGGVPLVYLQNSGIGNAVNPLLSLADPEVYGIPLVLLIGWRGEPGVRDEPQHVKQGRISPDLLQAMEIPHRVLDGDPAAATANAHWAVATARQRSGPVALLVRKGAFGPAEQHRAEVPTPSALIRETAIAQIAAALPERATVVATTGHIARELYEERGRTGQSRAADFLTVGSMGHASQIALGIALARPTEPVVCLDGDGAAIMHMGGLATIGATVAPRNYLHVVLNNGVHDSVGAQPTAGFDIDLPTIARACGYRAVRGPLTEAAAIPAAVSELLATTGPAFLELHVRPGARADLGRPVETPAENKRLFTERLQQRSES
ncbi:phosphonopyruvate decarboxylase [Halorhodospira abdelmalekii]|uniref:phosphonopyruvate decarboxylase n=1 Tax=Halorhodospira abdelmalekii TaxID=421629 RepID=UPI001907B7C9|nr:phosphonopyruvate decarboxylase [Halorhodospira abdelmalekii]MBK1733888.1 phosphonopyruvate decarboxylase [Halorhodospira abdelmalekii]